MTENYRSVFAPYVTGLIAAKLALGYSYKTAAFHLKSFDQYCVASSASSTLSRVSVLGWAKAKNGEAASSHAPRLSAVRELGKHMQALGIRNAYRSAA